MYSRGRGGCGWGGKGRGRGSSGSHVPSGRGSSNRVGGHRDQGPARHIVKNDHALKPRRGSLPVGRGRGRGRGNSDQGDNSSRIICFQYAKFQRCSRGSACKYRHEPKLRSTSAVSSVPTEFLVKHCEIEKAHTMAIMQIIMTAQGIYTVSQDKFLKRWQPVRQADGHYELEANLTVPLEESCYSILYKDGWIFCGLWDGDIQAFSQDGIITTLKGHTKRVNCLLIHENVLISGGGDEELRLWQMDPATKKFSCTHTVKDSTPGAIHKLAVMGTNLVIGGSNGVAMCSLKTLVVDKLLPPIKFVSDFLEFQGHLIVAYSDGNLRVFDGEGGLKKELKPISDGASILSIAGLESGPRVICTHARGQVSTIVLPDFEFKLQFQAFEFGRVESVLCAGHDGIFVLGHQSGNLQLWQRVPPAEDPNI
eukprot:TRINITY_DN55443_c0_g1_i1.p1 TRINITY_DN55443_c0_g1~~TRINITY_DN55443_c0_g1_i1.p1  ORF type:complete len:423 (+),score=50.53 TRINITY_DN55443_c0_g1_i1:60-1328(+)